MICDDSNEIFEKYYSLLSREKISVDEDISLDDLGYIVKNFEKFVPNLPVASALKLSNVIPKLAELIVHFGLVKSFHEFEEREYDSYDFPFEAKNAEKCFDFLFTLLKYYRKIETSEQRKFLVQVLLLCGTHSSNYLWSSQRSVVLSEDFLRDLLIWSNHTELSSLLCDGTFFPTIFKAVLKKMRPILMKDTWMNNPSACYVFHWFLSHVKHPHLADYLTDVLPPSFMFSNHHSVPHQVLGIKCFDHILDNVPPSLIKADGIDDAIFDALKMHIYSKNASIVEVFYPCLLKLPLMNLQKANHLQWFKFDDVLQQLLQNIDIESDSELRHLFLLQMHLFIKSTPCFKHLQKSLKVLFGNLVANSVAEGKCRIVAIENIKELIRSCWPRMEHHCFDIMLGLLKTIYDIEKTTCAPPDDTCEECQKVIIVCTECLCLLKDACPKAFKDLAEEYINENDSMPGVKVIKEVLEDKRREIT